MIFVKNYDVTGAMSCDTTCVLSFARDRGIFETELLLSIPKGLLQIIMSRVKQCMGT